MVERKKKWLFRVQSWTTDFKSLSPPTASWWLAYRKACHCHYHHILWISLSSWIWPKCSSGNHDHCSQWLLSLWSVVCWCWECECSSPLTRTPRMCVQVAQWLSRIWLFVAPWTVGFSRQEYWSRLPFPTPGNQICFSCVSCIGRSILYHCTTWEAPSIAWQVHKTLQTLKARHKPGLPSLLSPGEQWRKGARNIQLYCIFPVKKSLLNIRTFFIGRTSIYLALEQQESWHTDPPYAVENPCEIFDCFQTN